jgi:oxalate decarboxylase
MQQGKPEPTAHTGKAEANVPSPAGSGTASPPRHPECFAISLTLLAGFVDAIGYVQLNHLFLSFMSGNSTHLGMTLARADWGDAAASAAIVAAFVAGSSAGTHLTDAFAGPKAVAVLGGELLLALGAVALVHAGHDRVALGLLAVAMGMQNTLHQVVTGVDLGRGFITGTLMNVGASLARSLEGRSEEAARAARGTLAWIAFVAGAVLGTAILITAGLPASLLVVAVAMVSLILLIVAGWI